MFNIGDKLTKENYTQGAIWCNANNCIINPDTWIIEAMPEPLPPTYEEVRQTREALYRDQKDPITCQIQSLRDEEETEEILAEIEALKVKRAEIVAKIKEENPYPEENE